MGQNNDPTEHGDLQGQQGGHLPANTKLPPKTEDNGDGGAQPVKGPNLPPG
jgi:hypothetical protein